MRFWTALDNWPVVRHELRRTARSPWAFLARYPAIVLLAWACYVAEPPPVIGTMKLNFGGSVVYVPRNYIAPGFDSGPWQVVSPEERRELAEYMAARAFLTIREFLQWQLVIIVLVAPAMTAGALGHEKERDTLLALLGTEMQSLSIVTQKHIARLLMIGQPLAFVAPLVILLGGIAGMPTLRIALAVGQVVVVTFALTAACMLSSVWTRRTSDALLGCYSAMLITAMVNVLYSSAVPWPDWLNPFAMLAEILETGKRGRPQIVLVHLVVYAVIGLLCFTLAAARLRPAALRQAEQRPGRWLWAFRAGVGADPVRWRERYVFGLAPLPWLRALPSWLALGGTFAFSAVLVVTAINMALARQFFPLLFAGEFQGAFEQFTDIRPERILFEVNVHGIVLCVVGGILVVVRCSSSIAEEKRRKTWDDLTITPLSLKDIVRSKRWGVFDAALPHAAAYAVPMMLIASLAGWEGVKVTGIWLAAAVAVIFIASDVGASVALPGQSPARPSQSQRTELERSIDRAAAAKRRVESDARPDWDYWDEPQPPNSSSDSRPQL